MANTVEIIFAARDAATGVVNSVTEATRAYHRSLQETNGIAGEVTGTIRNMLAAFGGYSVVKNAVTAGYSFNSTIEETRVGLGSLVYSMREFRDAAGEVVTGQQAFDAALAIGEDAQNRLRIAGLKTAATFEQLSKAYAQSYVPAVKAAFDETQIVKFSTAVTQAATAMRVPLDMLGEEVRSILTGNMTPRTTMLQPLMEAAGLTNEKIRQLNAEGWLYPAVMKALEGATMGAAEAAKNLSVRWSNLKDAAQQALGKGMEAGFEKIKGLIQEATDAMVTFNEETGEIKWNDDLINGLKAVDEKIFSIINGIRDMGKAIAEFNTNNPMIVEMTEGFGGLVLKAAAVVFVLRTVGGIAIWLRSLWVANAAFIASAWTLVAAAVVKGFQAIVLAAIGAQGTISLATAIIGAALATIALSAAALYAGWKIGEWISGWKLLGMTIGEAMQAGYASIAKLFAYAVYAWDMIGASARSAWGQVKEAGKALFYDFIAAIQESFPKMAKFFGLTDDYRKSADAARAAQNAVYQEFLKNQGAANEKLQKELAFQESIREEIFKGVDVRNKVADATEKAADATDRCTLSTAKIIANFSKLTAGTRDGAEAAVKYVQTHEAINQALDKLADIAGRAKTKIAEFSTDIRKLTATDREIKILDIEDAYRKDIEAIGKYKTDMERAVRELREKISKAEADAKEKNEKRDAKDPKYAVDPKMYADLENALKAQEAFLGNIGVLYGQAGEKRATAQDQTNVSSLAKTRAFIADQLREYTQLTGGIEAGYRADADALKAKLAEELADTKKTAEEKEAISSLYNEKIRQLEVVKPAEALQTRQSFIAAQMQEYVQLTGNIKAGYQAEAAALKAKLAEELADIKKSAEEKLAITRLYNEKIRQAEVVKPAEYDRAARESEINNRLANLDLIEAEGAAHRETLAERIRLTQEMISLQRQSLAAMPKTGNEQAWNVQMDRIVADLKKRAELLREELMASPVEAFKLGFKDLLNQWTDVGRQMYDIAQTTASSMQQAFSDIFFDAFQGKLQSVGDYITSFVNSVNRAIANYMAKMAAAGLVKFVAQAAGSYFTSGSGGVNGGMATSGGYAGGSYAGFHAGGKVGGQPSFYRNIPSIPDLIPRRHSGGLAPNERMVINKVGERYVTEEQNDWLTGIASMMRGMGGAAAPAMPGVGRQTPFSVEINIDNGDSGAKMEVAQQNVRFDYEKLIIDVVTRKMGQDMNFRNMVAAGGRI